MLKGKSVLEYTNLFSPNEYEKKKNNNTEKFSMNYKNIKMKQTY